MFAAGPRRALRSEYREGMRSGGMRTTKKTTKNIAVSAVVVLVMLFSTACRDTDKHSVPAAKVSRSTFKGTWPLVPDSGTLACEAGAITFRPTGSNDTYAVNAIAGSEAEKKGWQPSLEHIWLTTGGGQSDRPGVPRVPLTDLINAGLKLCGSPWGG